MALLLTQDVGRLPCSTCGMTANVDPDFHEERYAHAPTVRVDGVELRWNGWMQTFVDLAY